jgi:hypothetical protein
MKRSKPHTLMPRERAKLFPQKTRNGIIEYEMKLIGRSVDRSVNGHIVKVTVPLVGIVLRRGKQTFTLLLEPDDADVFKRQIELATDAALGI